MSSQLPGIVARATDLSRRRRTPVSTAHLVVALFQHDGEVARLLTRTGLSEVKLMAMLEALHEQGFQERPSSVELCLQRAQKLAEQRTDSPRGLHLLLSIVSDTRCAGAAGIVQLGVTLEALGSQLSEQREPAAQIALPQRETKLVAVNARSGGGERSARPRRDRGPARDRGFHSAALAEQTESKLLRRGLRGDNTETGLPLTAAEVEPMLPLLSLAVPAPAPLPMPAPAAPVLLDRSPATPRAVTRVRPSAPPVVNATKVAAFALDAEQFPLLCALGRNLTQLAAAGEIDAVIGRDVELELLLDVLARRRGNNPVLVGAPGVGKTALVEGLARKLVEQHDSALPLSGRVLIELSSSSLLAGTGVRGALSERLQMLKREVLKADGKLLIFIDEIHTLLSGEGAADSLGNELKTALARGELPVIGATTDAEYRRIFERDAALSRRFTRIEVAEPSRDDALEILRGVAKAYETHHRVRFTAPALEAAVDMSLRYLPLRQLPDKAVALLDQAGARAGRRKQKQVDEAGVAAVVSELSGVPLQRLLMQDTQALLALEAHLQARIVGQRNAITAIAGSLRKSAAGFRGQRPLGTFLFLGPTGVGKTEMAKSIGELLFPGTPITRIDMSELAESHAVARLFGAPPGYLGHEDGGQLTEAVRHRPYQMILLDEIEKAHIEVLLALLPLFDEGRLTDGRGRTVDFTNTVIVMTSNLGAESALARARIGFGEDADSSERPGHSTHSAQPTRSEAQTQNRALAAARAALPPELWNRIDEPLYFHALGELEVAQIALRMLAEVAKIALDKHRVLLDVDRSAIDVLLASGGFDRALGARPMRRTLSRLVEAPLAHALLARELAEGDRVVLSGSDGQLNFSRKSSAAPAAE